MESFPSDDSGATTAVLDAPDAPAGVGVSQRSPVAATPKSKTRLVDDTARWDRVVDAADKHWDTVCKATDKYVAEYRKGHYPDKETDDNSEDNVSVNFTFAYINMWKAMLHTNPPTYEVDARENAGLRSDDRFKLLTMINPSDPMAPPMFRSSLDARRSFAKAVEDVSNYSFEACMMDAENEAVLFNGLCRGQGWSKASFDDERGFARCDSVQPYELYVDPHARHSVRQAQFLCHVNLMPIEAARTFFDKIGLSSVEPNYTLTEEKGLRGDEFRKRKEDSPEKDIYKFFELWIKDGEDRTLLYVEWQTKKRLQVRPWPFKLENDDFPFTPLVFNRQYSHINDYFSDLEVVDGLRKCQEELLRFHKTSVKRGIAKKLLIDQTLDDDTVNKLTNSNDYEVVRIKAGNRGLESVVKLLDLNTEHDPANELSGELKSIIDEITGMADLVRGGADQANQTATESSIKASNQALRTGRRVKLYDAFQSNQLGHLTHINRQLMDPQEVARIAGEPSAWLWMLEASDPNDFRCDYTLGVAAGSTGQMAKTERMNRMARFKQACIQDNQLSGRPIWDIVAITEEIVREDNVRNADRFKMPPPPAMPMVPPGAPPMAGPGGPPPGPMGPMHPPPAPAGHGAPPLHRSGPPAPPAPAGRPGLIPMNAPHAAGPAQAAPLSPLLRAAS